MPCSHSKVLHGLLVNQHLQAEDEWSATEAAQALQVSVCLSVDWSVCLSVLHTTEHRSVNQQLCLSQLTTQATWPQGKHFNRFHRLLQVHTASCDSLPDFVDQRVAVQAAGCADSPLQPEQGAPQGPPAGPGAELALTISPSTSVKL